VPSALTSDLPVDANHLSGEDVRERMSGNLCRCGAHNGIIDAVMEYLQRRPERGLPR